VASGDAVSDGHVVTEDTGYDVGPVVRGVFSTRQKADAWIEARRAEYARRVREGDAIQWGAPACDVEEYLVDPDTEGQTT
jgi:hypothetical protein